MPTSPDHSQAATLVWVGTVLNVGPRCAKGYSTATEGLKSQRGFLFREMLTVRTGAWGER